MTGSRQAEMRYRVDPGDVPPEKAARRLHLTLARFNELLPNLVKRGFPEPDPDTGMFDLDAIDLWRRSRHRSDQSLALPEQNTQPCRPVRRFGEKLDGGAGEAGRPENLQGARALVRLSSRGRLIKGFDGSREDVLKKL